MSILDMIKEKKSEYDYFDSVEKAMSQLQERALALSKISKTDWYDAIIQYRESEVAACRQRLRTMKSNNFHAVQAELNLAERFLDWIKAVQVH